MESERDKVIGKLIEVFARDFPRRNHVIFVDMTTGSYRVDEVLAQELGQKKNERSTLPENWNQE